MDQSPPHHGASMKHATIQRDRSDMQVFLVSLDVICFSGLTFLWCYAILSFSLLVQEYSVFPFAQA